MRAALVLAIVAACRDGSDEPPPEPRAAPAPISTPIAEAAPPDAPPACRPDAKPCEVEHFDPPRSIDYFERYEYTPAGQIAIERMRSAGDGRLFKVETYTYDPRGRKQRVETRDGDGKLTFDEHYEYRGADKDPTWLRMDTDGDGKVDTVEHHRYRRDGDQYIDDEQDERFHTLYIKRFDAAGHMISHAQVPYGVKPGPGEKPDEFEYDEHGHVTRQTMWAHDGTPDYWTNALTYDACGNLLRLDEDWHTDGTVDETTTYRYDCADGH